MFNVGVIIPQYWRQDPSEHSNQNPVTFKSHSWQEQTLFPALREHHILFPSIFSGICSQLWVVSLLILADQDSGEYSMGFCSSPDSFSVRLCPLQCSLLRTTAAALSQTLSCVSLIPSPLGYIWAPSVSCSQELSSGSKLGNHKAQLICFLFLRDQCPLLPDWQLLVHEWGLIFTGFSIR